MSLQLKRCQTLTNSNLEYYQRDVAARMRAPWTSLDDAFSFRQGCVSPVDFLIIFTVLTCLLARVRRSGRSHTSTRCAPNPRILLQKKSGGPFTSGVSGEVRDRDRGECPERLETELLVAACLIGKLWAVSLFAAVGGGSKTGDLRGWPRDDDEMTVMGAAALPRGWLQPGVRAVVRRREDEWSRDGVFLWPLDASPLDGADR